MFVDVSVTPASESGALEPLQGVLGATVGEESMQVRVTVQGAALSVALEGKLL